MQRMSVGHTPTDKDVSGRSNKSQPWIFFETLGNSRIPISVLRNNCEAKFPRLGFFHRELNSYSVSTDRNSQLQRYDRFA